MDLIAGHSDSEASEHETPRAAESDEGELLWEVPRFPEDAVVLPEIATKVERLLQAKAQRGTTINKYLEAAQAFWNPKIIDRQAEMLGIDQTGTFLDAQIFAPKNFRKDVFLRRLAALAKGELPREEAPKPDAVEVAAPPPEKKARTGSRWDH